MSISGGSLEASRADRLKARGVSMLADLRLAAEIALFAVALIWLVQAVNVADGYRLDTEYGIVARSVSSLPHIITAPFLHLGLAHIESNTPPLALLTFLAVLGGVKRYLLAVAMIILVGGLGTWLFSPVHSDTVGASGLIFGLLGYVVVRGLFARSLWRALWQVAIGVAVFAYYQWTVVLLYPSATVTTMHISWQGHLSGLAAGVLAAVAARRRDESLNDEPRLA